MKSRQTRQGSSGPPAGRAPWPGFARDFTRQNASWLAAMGFMPALGTDARAVFRHPETGALLVAEWDPWDVCMDLWLGPPLGRPRQDCLAYPLQFFAEATGRQEPRLGRRFAAAAKDPTFKALRRLLQELMPRYGELLPGAARLWKERAP